MSAKKPHNPLVTCVVPVYNAEKYLKQCVDSLLEQTYDNVEIILVDDQSTDSSWLICSKYADEKSNIRIYRNAQNFGGPLRGRERGINEALGEWVTFVDCDDYVKPDYIRNLVDATHNGKYDIAITGHSRLYPDGRIEDYIWESYSQSTEERLVEFYAHLLQKKYYINPIDSVGQNLVRTSIAKKVDLSKYPNTIYGEDVIMALNFLAHSKNGVNFVNHHDFIWRQVEGSASHGGFYRSANKNDFFKACFDIFHRKNTYSVISSNSPLISIIIPIYNVEKYLEECLDSVLAQTYLNTEIILVDDKTPDKSGKIADAYAKKDKRIKVIHKPKNEGLNMARATGFQASTGTLVMFVDSDDMLTSNALQKSYSAIIREEADLVAFAFGVFSEKTQTRPSISNQNEESRLLQGKEEIAKYAFFGDNALANCYHMTVCGKLYMRDILKEVDWETSNYRSYEDIFFTPQALLLSSRLAILGDELYLYRRGHTHGEQNPEVLSGSLIGNTYNGKPIGYLELIKLRVSLYRKLCEQYNLVGFDERITKIEQSLMWSRLSHLVGAELLGSENNTMFIKEVFDKHHEYDRTQDDLIHDLLQQNTALKNEIASFTGMKRSTRLLAGNVKRKFIQRRSR